MIAALRVLWRSLQHLNHRGYLYIWANVAAVVCALPIVTAPAAWAGLVRLSMLAHRQPSADLGDFRTGFVENLRRGLVLGVLNVVVVGVNVTNLTAYGHRDDLVSILLRSVWMLTLVLWLSVQLYVWPIFYQMEQPTLGGALRNALVMVVRNPLFTLVLWLGILVVVLLSTAFFVAWLLLSVSVLAVIVTGAVLNRLDVPVYDPRDDL